MTNQIPREVQIEAACSISYYEAFDILSEYVPGMKEWEPSKESGRAYKEYITSHFDFTPEQLIKFMRNHKDQCKNLLIKSNDTRSTPNPFFSKWKDNQYRVGWVDPDLEETISQIRVYGSLHEAAADYILLKWRLPRLKKIDADWYEMEKY